MKEIMHGVTKEELQTLVKAHSSDYQCVSLYLPTVRGGKESQQNVIRLKNLYRQAHSQLQAVGKSEETARKYLKPVASLIEDHDIWLHPSDGLAVFLGPETFQTIKLPYAVNEVISVSDSFHLKPLLPMLEENVQFYILSLSQKAVHLYLADRYAIREIPVEDVPRSMQEALQHDSYEPSLQSHSGGVTGQGAITGIRHGQGPGREDEKKNLHTFFHQVDRGLHRYLGNAKAPLVLAAVDYYFPIYREVSTYSNLIASGVEGSPDHKSVEELHKEGWKKVEAHFNAQLERTAKTIEEAIGKGKGCWDLETAVPAAHHGRIETCFVALDKQQWGLYDEESEEVTLVEEERPRVKDLVDFVAVNTWIHKGHVFPVKQADMPGGGLVAAHFRY